MKWINKLKCFFWHQYRNLFYWLEWRFSDERKNPYRCTECGSTDVELKVWSKVNEGGRYSGDCEEYNHSFCNSCNENIRIRPTTDLLINAQTWWENMNVQEKERFTKHSQVESPYRNETHKFVDSCNEWWHKLSAEEKIRMWINESAEALD